MRVHPPTYSAGRGMTDRINLERLHEASDAALAAAHAAALDRAHSAPKGAPWSDAWSRFSREADRIGNEIARRKSSP